jgi:hypothetical protein
MTLSGDVRLKGAEKYVSADLSLTDGAFCFCKAALNLTLATLALSWLIGQKSLWHNRGKSLFSFRPCGFTGSGFDLHKFCRRTTMRRSPYSNDAYTVGWISASHNEFVVGMAVLDEEHGRPQSTPADDSNAYHLSRLSEHKAVMACLSGCPRGEGGGGGALPFKGSARTAAIPGGRG